MDPTTTIDVITPTGSIPCATTGSGATYFPCIKVEEWESDESGTIKLLCTHFPSGDWCDPIAVPGEAIMSLVFTNKHVNPEENSGEAFNRALTAVANYLIPPQEVRA